MLHQLSGDTVAGIYECRSCCDGSTDAGQVATEGYCWGGLTSGAATRALWLLFVPFVLINLAHWMLPPSKTGRTASAITVTLLRLLGLGLSLTLMLAAVEVTIDIVGWQCGSTPHCGSGLGPVNFVLKWPLGARLAVTAIPVAVMPLALVWLGRSNPPALMPRAYPDSDAAPKRAAPPDPAVTDDRVPLAEFNFWGPDDSVKRLRSCHVMAWMSGLGAITLAPPVDYPGSSGLGAACLVLLWIQVGVLALSVLATASTRLTGRGGVGADWLTRPMYWSQWAATSLLVATLVVVWFTQPTKGRSPAEGPMPGVEDVIDGLLWAELLLLVGLFIFCAVCLGGRRRGRPRDGFAPSLDGFVAPFVAAVALSIAGGFSAGVGLFVARYVGTPVRELPATNADIPIVVPPGYFAAAIVFSTLGLVLIGIALMWWVTRLGARTRAAIPEVLADYRGRLDTDSSRAAAVARARVLASLTDEAPRALAALIFVGIFAFVLLRLAGLAGWFNHMMARAPSISNACVALLAGAAASFIGLAVTAFRDSEKRRLVGVLWDVITFWPRANHPLTPPCYGERAVPELVGQLTYLTRESPARRVVVAAHSQGTIIAAATVLQLVHANRQHIGLLTFGCPLRRLYAKNFPAYFGPNTLATIRHRQRNRWINLWALSDPIGSWVHTDLNAESARALREVDWRLLDVTGLGPEARGSMPPICGHSGFWTRPEYHCAESLLLRSLQGSQAISPTIATRP
jgi:hypothetical protein